MAQSLKSLLAKYKRLEAINEHTEATLLLAINFGTEDEIETMTDMKDKQEKRGHSLAEEIHVRYSINKKYYKLLFV